jgi:hypothetical protein
MNTIDQVAFDSQIAHAMQMWLWRALAEQLERQELLHPWDLYEGLSHHENHAWATPADRQGFIEAMAYIKQRAQQADPRPYEDQAAPTP